MHLRPTSRMTKKTQRQANIRVLANARTQTTAGSNPNHLTLSDNIFACFGCFSFFVFSRLCLGFFLGLWCSGGVSWSSRSTQVNKGFSKAGYLVMGEDDDQDRGGGSEGGEGGGGGANIGMVMHDTKIQILSDCERTFPAPINTSKQSDQMPKDITQPVLTVSTERRTFRALFFYLMRTHVVWNIDRPRRDGSNRNRGVSTTNKKGTRDDCHQHQHQHHTALNGRAGLDPNPYRSSNLTILMMMMIPLPASNFSFPNMTRHSAEPACFTCMAMYQSTLASRICTCTHTHVFYKVLETTVSIFLNLATHL